MKEMLNAQAILREEVKEKEFYKKQNENSITQLIELQNEFD